MTALIDLLRLLEAKSLAALLSIHHTQGDEIWARSSPLWISGARCVGLLGPAAQASRLLPNPALVSLSRVRVPKRPSAPVDLWALIY